MDVIHGKCSSSIALTHFMWSSRIDGWMNECRPIHYLCFSSYSNTHIVVITTNYFQFLLLHSFGYVVEGSDFLQDIKEGDVIVSAEVTDGLEYLVQPKD
jgi:cyclophilin family peptidyl-prolyl cis-trans isomerase